MEKRNNKKSNKKGDNVAKTRSNRENKKKIYNRIIAASLVVIIFALVIFAIIKTTSKPKITSYGKRQIYTVSYKLFVDNKEYTNGTISFSKGEFSDSLGLKSNKADNYVNNLNIGESVNISLKASEAYGEYNYSLRKILPRTLKQKRNLKQNLTANIPKQQFVKLFGSEPIVNQSYDYPTLLFPIKVIGVNNYVKVIYDIKKGDISKSDALGFWFEVTDINKEKNIVELKINTNRTSISGQFGSINISLDEDNIYYSISPEKNKVIYWANETGIVVDYNSTNIVIDNNNPLAGKDIVLWVQLVNISTEILSDKVKGKNNAPVTIVEYSDFQCPYCSRFYSETYKRLEENYIQTGKVKLIFKHFPLSSLHPLAEKAAIAAECANEQGKFWEYHDILFERQNDWTTVGEKKFKEYANELGLDITKFDNCLTNEKYKDKVMKEYQDGINAGVTGTPTFFINGEKVVGAQPYNAFKDIIEKYL